MSRKMLITGGQGMFATDMARIASSSGLEVIAMSHSDLDVTNKNQIRDILDRFHPRYVIHTVGLLTDVCETRPEDAYRVHAWATGCLAAQCQRIGATLVHLSTCGVFGDERRFYSEYEPVVLKTRYAHSKYLAEQAAAARCRRTYNVRPGWLYGSTTSHRKNFVFQRYLEAKRNPVVKAAADKFGSPTYTVDLAVKILELLDTEEYGLYHVSNKGGGSRYDYVKCIIKAFGLSTRVEPVDSSFFPRPTSTPDSEMLENLNIRLLGLREMDPWEETLERYVRQLEI
jgi:dTDP-4-dehydrorhamnose reductase